jgi:prophage regulatory protein
LTQVASNRLTEVFRTTLQSSEEIVEQQALIDYRGLKEEKGIKYSKSQLWNLEKANKFPKRIYLSQVRVAWIEAEVDKWIKSRIAARDRKNAAA